jgi:hypothetical protein
MQRVELQSTTVKAAVYQPQSAWLDLEFPNGAIYRYQHVPIEVYQQLLQAESKGRYFNQHIRDRFPTIKLHPSGSSTIDLPRRQSGIP